MTQAILKLMIGIMLFIPIVYGIESGNIYTQEQVNNLNIDNIDHNFLKCHDMNYIKYYKNSHNISLSVMYNYYTCLDMIPINLTHYEVIDIYEGISLERYMVIYCLTHYNPLVCGNYYTSYCQHQVLFKVEEIKNRVKGYQTSTLEEPYYSWAINTDLIPD